MGKNSFVRVRLDGGVVRLTHVTPREAAQMTEEELLGMMPNDRTKALYNRKYVSAFAKEMVRSTKEIFKNWNRKD